MRLVLLTLVVSIFGAVSLHAAETAKDNPLTRLDRKTEELMKGLDENQTLQFEKIRTAHGTIRAVNDVRASLERAVKSCTGTNPDLKDPMNARMQSWKNAVLPTVRQGENRLEKMILTQSFTRPSTVRAYLKTFDDAVKYQDNAFKEIPVSEIKACTSLMKNMDDSEKVMAKLITETLGLNRELATKDQATQ